MIEKGAHLDSSKFVGSNHKDTFPLCYNVGAKNFLLYSEGTQGNFDFVNLILGNNRNFLKAVQIFYFIVV